MDQNQLLSGKAPGRVTTADLVKRARGGSRTALNDLFARHLAPLRFWAHGRLPRWARGIAETADMVQDVLLNTLRRLDGIDVRRKGALQSYLRQAIQNRVRDELRHVARVAPTRPLDSDSPDPGDSPLETALDAETTGLYLRAVKRLRPDDQELIVGSIELGYTYEQLAIVTGRSGREAARVAVRRALKRLAEQMRDA